MSPSPRLKRGYKIVTERNVSMMGHGSVKYEVRQWTTPKVGCGPLAVFETKKDARSFMRLALAFRLYSCWYVPAAQGQCLYEGRLEVGCYHGYASSCYTQDRIVVTGLKEKENTPQGTVLAAAVMLDKLIPAPKRRER